MSAPHDELFEASTDKQRRILEAAVEVFAEKGYAGTPTAEIARRAGVAEGTIFKTWKTKKELLLGVVAPLFARLVAPQVIAPVIEILEAGHPDLESMVRALARERIAFMRRHVAVVRVFVQELAYHPELRDLAVQTLGPRLVPLFLENLARFQREGSVVAGPKPTSLMRLIMGTMMTYAATRFVLFPEADWDDEAEIELMVRLLSRGLAP